MVSLFGRGFESHQLHKEVIIYYTDSYLFFYVLSFSFHFFYILCFHRQTVIKDNKHYITCTFNI